MFADDSSQQSANTKQFNKSFGLDMPIYGWNIKYKGDKIDKVSGINLGIGYSVKNYIGDASLNKLTPYVSYGTILLILPYLGVGVDFISDSGMYIGAGLIYIFPEIHLGFYF